MLVAGERLTRADVLLLATLLADDPLGRRLREAAEHGTTIFTITQQERVRVLNGLEDPPFRLRGLRDTLVAQQKLRARRRHQAHRLEVSRARADVRQTPRT